MIINQIHVKFVIKLVLIVIKVLLNVLIVMIINIFQMIYVFVIEVFSQIQFKKSYVCPVLIIVTPVIQQQLNVLAV